MTPSTINPDNIYIINAAILGVLLIVVSAFISSAGKEKKSRKIGISESDHSSEVGFNEISESTGVQVWCVYKTFKEEDDFTPFRLKKCPRSSYGEFYIDHSYVILSTKEGEDGEGPLYDIYFWIGSESLQRTYKYNKVDEQIGSAAIQQCIVQDHETDEFIQLFADFRIKYLSQSSRTLLVKPGDDDREISEEATTIVEDSTTDNNKSAPVENTRDLVVEEDVATSTIEEDPAADTVFETGMFRTTAMLLHVRRPESESDRVTRSYEVPLTCDSLNKGDCFVLDANSVVYTWYGSDSSPFERQEAMDLVRSIVNSRSGNFVRQVIDVQDDDEEFWNLLGGKQEIKPADEYRDEHMPTEEEPKMYVLCDATGEIEVSVVPVAKSSLVSDDVCLVDTGKTIFVWIGKGSTKREQSQAVLSAQKYIKGLKRDKVVNIMRVLEGQENRATGFMEVLGEA